MEAIIEQNIETKKYRVAVCYKEETPSGCTRMNLHSATEDMEEEKALQIQKELNQKFESRQC